MDSEFTLGDIFEDIAERLAAARTKALMGERQEALGVFRGASLEFTRFREVLKDYPGYHALEHAFQATLTALHDEQSHEQHTHRSTDTPRQMRVARPRK